MLGSIIVGLIAGWAAGKIMRGEGYGAICDIILGLVGAVVGGAIFGVLGLHAHHAIGSIIIATVGAMSLVAASRIVAREV
jgi:uncharacterized membrane protein YeaQ/YmgE (transglycosylase-associated protein family)